MERIACAPPELAILESRPRYYCTERVKAKRGAGNRRCWPPDSPRILARRNWGRSRLCWRGCCRGSVGRRPGPPGSALPGTWQVRGCSATPWGRHAGPLQGCSTAPHTCPPGRTPGRCARSASAVPGGAGVAKLEADKRQELVRHAIAENPQRRGKRPCGLCIMGQ